MKKFLFFLLWLAAVTRVSAATHAVLPGEAIQPVINAAAPGDVIALFGGSYPDEITINKTVRLVEADGEDVILLGNITWTAVTDALPFVGFTVGSSGKVINVNNTTGLVIKNVDARGAASIKVNGASRVSLLGSQFTKIEQDGGDLDVSLSLVTGNFETTVNSQKTVAFRTTVNTDAKWNTKRCWFGYSKARLFTFEGSDSKVVIIGSEFDRQNLLSFTVPGAVNAYAAITLGGGSNDCLIANCIVKNVKYNNWGGVSVNGALGIHCSSSNMATIANNYIQLTKDQDQGFNDSAFGIRSDSSNTRIYNNIIDGGQYSVRAPFGADVRNNCAYRSVYGAVHGGAVPTGTVSGDPAFVTNQAPTLQLSSICIDGGISEPTFNDLDGTRNNIGPGGGCFYDPDGWTTNKPVVISFDLGPRRLVKGRDSQVTISKGQAVSEP